MTSINSSSDAGCEMTTPNAGLEGLVGIAAEMRARMVNHGKSTSPTLIAWADRIDAIAGQLSLPGAEGDARDALGEMFPGLQSDLSKLTTGARLMDSFENPDWNQARESLEGRVVAAATALMSHTEAAGMTLEKDGISIRIAPIAYAGEVS